MRFRVPFFALVLAACHSSPDVNNVPSFVQGDVQKATYDGTTTDLLTGGLGKTALGGGQPTYVNAASPTAAELRTMAIFQNYRALVDITPGGGYGVLYGPNIDTSGNDTLGEGKIAGDEWIAY